MELNKDYLKSKKITMNEGFKSGATTKVIMYFTKDFFFIVPIDGINMWENSDTKYSNSKEFIAMIDAEAPKLTIKEFEQKMFDFLPEDRIYEVGALAKFKIMIGFWIFGSFIMKKNGGERQVVNMQPKSMRAALSEFYGLDKKQK